MNKRIENRNLLSSFFVTVLVGIAWHEMAVTMKEVTIIERLDTVMLMLPAVFFFIAIRFFIGNQLHLLSKPVVKLPGTVWLFDLMVIICQCFVLILLATRVSVPLNLSSSITFLDFMVLLYTIDVIWIVVQWAMSKLSVNWRRDFVPSAWAILNAVLIAALYMLDRIFGHSLYTSEGLGWLLGINVAGFVVDVLLVDYYQTI